MSCIISEKAIGLSKFRGVLIGALMGDCLGSPYEGDETVSKVILQRYFDKLEEVNFKSPLRKYTDDTAMTKAIADSLSRNGTFDETDIAKRFVSGYYSDPGRGYGQNVIDVFKKLKNSKFSDIWRPAREQFSGSGSLGNGGAMRISPLALYYCKDYNNFLSAAEQCTKLTHTHRLGINGALLQGIAIQESLKLHPMEPFCTDRFTEVLLEKMAAIEAKDKNEIDYDDSLLYQNQLKEIQRLLLKENASDHEVLEALGNGVQALYSVPTAIYCFLRAQQPFQHIKTNDRFRRVLQYSISLGGDTDTIASMAGAISGAHHGFDCINKTVLSHCEASSEVLQLSDDLYGKVFA